MYTYLDVRVCVKQMSVKQEQGKASEREEKNLFVILDKCDNKK